MFFAVIINGVVEHRVVSDYEQSVVVMFPDAEIIQETEATGPAAPGVSFDYSSGKFYPPSCVFDSWVFNSETWNYEPPHAAPSEGGPYVWSEESVDWIEITLPEETDEEPNA